MSNHLFSSRRVSIVAVGFLVTLGVLPLGGCSRTVKICPASGTILVNGQPVEGAYIVFHSLDDPTRLQSPDTARTLKDGTFSARVRGPGEYAVTVFWPRITRVREEVVEGEDYFNGKYRSLAQPVLKTTIQDGENPLPPIRLTYP